MFIMESFGIILVLIALSHARPSDYDELVPEKLSYGLKSGEQDNSSNPSDEHNEPNAYYPTGVFTKYPNIPEEDEYISPAYIELPSNGDRAKRQTDVNDSIDVNKQAINESKEEKRFERKTDDQMISLRSFIHSIESDLVGKAQAINSNVRLRRSLSTGTVNEANSSEHFTSTGGSIDTNKDLFEGLFEYTRPERQSDKNDGKIPLDGLVKAVETTLINSAQKLKDPETSKLSKRDISSNDDTLSKRNADEPLDDKLSSAIIQVKKITSSNDHDLNLLKPIEFNAAASVELSSSTDPSSCSDENITTTDISPIQQTNLSVVHSSNTVHLLPDSDQKLAHVQHQQIQRTVFHSNLAIFPTISPQSINVPNLLSTTTGDSAEDVTSTIHPIESVPDKTVSVDSKRLSFIKTADKLKEEIAEIQAEPIILSQI